jgi:BolA family transcriptional regulator, general stress-responsive regulator
MIGQIRQRLADALAPTELTITDEGHLHLGHAGEGKGHFHVQIVSMAFVGLSPLQKHRMVYVALGDLVGNGIHALSIDAKNK